MSAMPEIGSKISLISKADIRYEGKLFTVDPTECTIALASVRSFGTEDRQAQYPVPAQSQVYDYILFRGTDIKDISIVNTQQLPNDPAIVSGMAPSMNPPSYQPHGFNHPVMGGMGPGMNQYGYNPMNNMAPGIGRSMSKQPLPSELVNVAQVPEPQPQPPVVQVPAPTINIPVKDHSAELIAGSRSSTPGLLSRKSPTMDQGIQVSGPSPHRDDKTQNHRPIGQHQVNRDGRHSRGERGYQDGYQRQQMNDRNDYRQRDHGLNQNRRDMYPHPGGQSGLPQRNQGQGTGSNRGWIRVNNGAGGPPRPRGRGRPGSGPQQNFNRAPGTGQTQNQQGQKKNVLKFDEEYDFDKANTEFEEEYKLLRNQMAKIKIGDNVDVVEPVAKVNGEDKKDDSGNETGVGEGEPEEEPVEIFYDKAKSFFDNISCEAVERSKGRSQRTDWRTERKLNSETFGVASARRGNFRGRGGYYHGRGMYRGGYGMNRGGYNRGQGGRQAPRPNNTMHQNSSSAPRPQAQAAQAK